MATLNELMEKFGSAADYEAPTAGDAVPDETFAVEDGQTKIASGGGEMNTLQDIYLSLAETDFEKEASYAAGAPDDDVDFAKIAEAMADAEAGEVLEHASYDAVDSDEIIKVAAEYDSAGRIMARGFYDEFMKLSGAMDTDVTPNQMTESESEARTPDLGPTGLPTVPTNFAGTANHDKSMETTGPEHKKVYADTLKPAKTISAGQGTGDDPEAMAISAGGGSPAGFATVRDLAGGKPA